MLWNDSAKIVDPVNYQLYDWSDWSRIVPDRDEPFIQSVRQRIRIPEVIALTKFDAMPTQKVTFSRRNVFKRDKMCCQYCGKQPGNEELTIDHVVPRAQGGLSTWTNCVLACIDCNSKKAELEHFAATRCVQCSFVSPRRSGLRQKRPPRRCGPTDG